MIFAFFQHALSRVSFLRDPSRFLARRDDVLELRTTGERTSHRCARARHPVCHRDNVRDDSSFVPLDDLSRDLSLKPFLPAVAPLIIASRTLLISSTANHIVEKRSIGSIRPRDIRAVINATINFSGRSNTPEISKEMRDTARWQRAAPRSGGRVHAIGISSPGKIQPRRAHRQRRVAAGV